MYTYVQSFIRPLGKQPIYFDDLCDRLIKKAGYTTVQAINDEFLGDLSEADLKNPAFRWRNKFNRMIEQARWHYVDEYDSHYIPDGNPETRVAILFTGGMDSTALALNALRAGKTVVPIVTQMNFDAFKYNFLTYVSWAMLRNEFGKRIEAPVQSLKVRCDVTVKECFEGFFQQPTNAYSLAYLPTKLLKSVSEIQMGLVQGDQSIPYMEDMQRIYQSTIRLSKGIGMDECLKEFKDIPPLTFPLCNTPKSEVLKILKSGPKDHSWYAFSCENPIMSIQTFEGGHTLISLVECGGCHSCERLVGDGQKRKSMIIQLLNSDNGDKPIPFNTNELQRIGTGFFNC